MDLARTPVALLPAAVAIALSVPPVWGQPTPAPTLRLERWLGAGRAAQDAEGISFARADRISGNAVDQLQLEGNAEVRTDGAVLRGDRILYDYAEDRLRVLGNARVFRDGALFTGPQIDYRLEAQTGSMPEAEFVYQSIGGRGSARELQFLGPELARLLGAEFTTCTPEDRAWWLQAERLDIDRIDESAIARNARLYFQDVPIFASPVFEFPLGSRRRSGFLTPGFGINSKVGWEATTPYYFDIAPNRDATIAPRIMAKRGVLLQNEFRYLEPTWRGQVKYDFINNDREFGDARHLLSLQHNWAGRSGFGAGVNYNEASDDTYFADFGRNLVEGTVSVLPQEGYVSYARTYWASALRVTKNQTLQDPLAPVDKPYERVPQFTLNASRLNWYGADATLAVEATRFENALFSNGVRREEGTRVIANPSVSYPWLAPGWFVIPKLQWSSTRYELDPEFRPLRQTRSRDLPLASLDSGLVFERDTTWFGREGTQTLEPRLFYAYVPFREQNDLPNFDSALADFNFAQLFNENVFVGGDRIAEANQLTAALVSRILDQTGAERLRAAIGQRYYFGPQRVALPVGVGAREEGSSDLLLGLNGVLTPQWIVDLALQHSTEQDRVVRSTIGLRYQPRAASVISAVYRYKVNELEQFDLAAQWPLARRWYGVGRLNYSTRDGRWVEVLGGLEYKADCWVLRVAAQRFATTTDNATTAVFFAIELNGLGSVGTSPVEQLRRNIPGYQLINPPPSQPGRFDYYE